MSPFDNEYINWLFNWFIYLAIGLQMKGIPQTLLVETGCFTMWIAFFSLIVSHSSPMESMPGKTDLLSQ